MRRRPRIGPALLVGLLLTAGAVSARTADGEPTIEPGAFEEFDLRMDAGWTIDYHWSADAPLHFNIHSHPGSRVEYHVEDGPVNGSEGRFEAPDRRTYSLLWENRGDQPVATTWGIDGDWIARSEHFDDEETTPGPGTLAVLAALVVAAVTRYRSW